MPAKVAADEGKREGLSSLSPFTPGSLQKAGRSSLSLEGEGENAGPARASIRG